MSPAAVRKKTRLIAAVPIGLFAIVAIGVLADRVIWVDQVVAGVNLANAPIPDVNCPTGNWLEVAPGKNAEQPMRYRCGFMFWPFYRSGESKLVVDSLKDLETLK